jgi:hypothetical protein
MTHKLIKTDNYLLVVDDSVHPYDSSKVGNPLAHLPLNGSPILEGVPLLPPYSRHQEDGLEEYAQSCNQLYKEWLVTGYKSGYNKAREKYKYTEEDMIICWNTAYIDKHQIFGYQIGGYHKKFIQSIHQYPTEFECEMEDYGHYEMGIANFIKHGERPKTITTAQGVQWVGKYK